MGTSCYQHRNSTSTNTRRLPRAGLGQRRREGCRHGTPRSLGNIRILLAGTGGKVSPPRQRAAASQLPAQAPRQPSSGNAELPPLSTRLLRGRRFHARRLLTLGGRSSPPSAGSSPRVPAQLAHPLGEGRRSPFPAEAPFTAAAHPSPLSSALLRGSRCTAFPHRHRRRSPSSGKPGSSSPVPTKPSSGEQEGTAARFLPLGGLPPRRPRRRRATLPSAVTVAATAGTGQVPSSRRCDMPVLPGEVPAPGGARHGEAAQAWDDSDGSGGRPGWVGGWVDVQAELADLIPAPEVGPTRDERATQHHTTEPRKGEASARAPAPRPEVSPPVPLPRGGRRSPPHPLPPSLRRHRGSAPAPPPLPRAPSPGKRFGGGGKETNEPLPSAPAANKGEAKANGAARRRQRAGGGGVALPRLPRGMGMGLGMEGGGGGSPFAHSRC